jgi:lysophospholipase L1-like esterase
LSDRGAPGRRLSASKIVLYTLVIDAVLLLALEGGARLFFPAPDASRFGELSRLTVELGLPALQRAVEPDPVLFWKLRPGLPPTLIEGRIGPSDPIRFTLSTTPAGFRSPGPEDPLSVVCVGDSCTFGLGVGDGETFPARLAAATGLGVLNAGVPGYSAFQGRRLLGERIGSWRPRDVVIQFGWNDAAVWDGRSDEEHAALLARGPGLLYRSRLVQLLASLLPKSSRGAGDRSAGAARPRLTPEEFGDELRSLIRLARSRGARPILVLWPARYHLRAIRVPRHLDVIRHVASEEGAPLVDLFDVFSRHGGDSLYADAVHANAAGNRAVADALARVLTGSSPGSSSAGASGRSVSP